MDAVHDPLQVLATTEEGTVRALTEAKRLTHGSQTRVVLVVPHLLSYLSAPTDATETSALTDRYRTLAAAMGVDAVVRVCVCSHLDDVLKWTLRRRSRVVIGGRRGRWWPTTAQRIAQRLEQDGHDVVFAAL